MSNDDETQVADAGKVPAATLVRTPAVRSEAAVAIGAAALGILTLGALAVGALAIGTLAIGQLALGRARLRSGRVDELRIGATHHRGTAGRACAGQAIGEASEHGRQDPAGPDRRQRQRHVVGPLASAGGAGQCGCRIDGGLHHQSRQCRSGAPGVRCPPRLRRLPRDDRLAGDRRGRRRRACAVALRAGQGGARGRQARLLRMATRADDRRGRGTRRHWPRPTGWSPRSVCKRASILP